MAFQPSFNPETGRFKILVRLSYFKGFEKTASTDGGALKYRTNGLIDKNTEEGKASIKALNQAIKAMVNATWPGKDLAKFKEVLGDGPKGRWPLFDGDKYLTQDGDIRNGYEGQRYVKLTNDKKIKYKDRRGNEIDDEDKLRDLFQSGHWAVGYGHLFPVKDEKKGGNGMFVTCDALQFFKRDALFEGGGIDDSEIDDLGDDGDEDDLSSGGNGIDDDL